MSSERPSFSQPRNTEDDVEAQHPDEHHVRIASSIGSDQAPHHNFDNISLQRSATGFSTRSSIGGIKQRPRRSNTARTYQPTERAAGWEPGQEPGLDTSDPVPPYTGGDDDTTTPSHQITRCEITVIDWSQDEMRLYHLDNDNLAEFLETEKPAWVLCRWINVNGLSWDVIRLLGNHKGLHRLAIEDLMNTRNRTKADFYNDHTFMVLSLQKLINLSARDKWDSDSSSEDSQPGWKEKNLEYVKDQGKRKPGAIITLLKEWFKAKEKVKEHERQRINSAKGFRHMSPVESPFAEHPVRTLQRYHAGPNEDRIEFMERHGVLTSKDLGVAMEQVSIFLNSDNTVTSFFESSAQDVELPIIKRLNSSETILRQCCDASMLVQAIIDTIVDLAIPVTTAYQDAIGDIELSVLTDPDIHQSTSLYILTSEIAVLRNAIAPISAIVSALKDHKIEVNPNDPTVSRPPLHQRRTNGSLSKPIMATGVPISPLTHTYLGDIDDHIQLITQSYDSMRRSADNLVDLIFNTIGAYQNESMKQLTIVTIMFLPLSFLTGYFGMNFKDFHGIEHSDSYFWKIAVPFVFVTTILILRDAIGRFFVKKANKRLVRLSRKRRGERKKERERERYQQQGRNKNQFPRAKAM